VKYFQLSLRYWALSLIVGLALLAGLELFFRREALWRQPLGLALTVTTDINTRAVWLSYQPPGPADRRVLLVGASTALASMQLLEDGTSRMFTDAAGSGTVEFRSLCVGGASFADYLTLTENAIAHGYTPDLIIMYIGPSMFTDEGVRKAQGITRFIPLVSSDWLEALEQQRGGGIRQKLYHWALRHSAVFRHRYYVNTWIHRRLAYVLRREFNPMIRLDETRYRHARRGPLEADRERYESVSTIPDRFQGDAASSTGMLTLLNFLQERQIRGVLLEAPRSPPARGLYEPINAAYTRIIEQAVRQYGIAYVDPNERLYLDADDFADMYHVSWKGRTRWLQAVVPVLAPLIR
jgi:hypothetical protein